MPTKKGHSDTHRRKTAKEKAAEMIPEVVKAAVKNKRVDPAQAGKPKSMLKEHLRPHIESPTWGHVQRMAEVVMNRLGGPQAAAQGLSTESFYTLCMLQALNLDEKKAATFIFGKQYLT